MVVGFIKDLLFSALTNGGGAQRAHQGRQALGSCADGGVCGLLAVDNVISHAGQVRDFRALVSADPRVTEALAPTGAGVLLVVREKAPAT